MMPQETHRRDAVGLETNLLQSHPEFDAAGTFEPIPCPTHQDDWLAQYVPDNQTYTRWERSTRPFRSALLKSLPFILANVLYTLLMHEPPLFLHSMRQHFLTRFASNCRRQASGKKIYLVALGDMTTGAPQTQHLVEYTQAFFDPFEVTTLPPIRIVDAVTAASYPPPTLRRRLPKTAHYALVDFDGSGPIAYPLKSRRCHPYYEHRVHGSHLQLAIDPILDVLEDFRPDDCLCFLAVTMYDLYEGKDDAFAVGMATGIKDKIGVFSFCRYDPLFDEAKAKPKSNPKKSKVAEANYNTLLFRSCKVLAHEIGHLVGIEHCSYYDCMMNGSGHLAEDFRQSMHLCPVDLRKILTLTGSNWDAFYQKLSAFFKAHGFAEEVDWIAARVEKIEEMLGKKRENAKEARHKIHRDAEEEELAEQENRILETDASREKREEAAKGSTSTTTTTRRKRAKIESLY